MKGVFVVGASGSGKTTLARTLAQQYRAFLQGQHIISINLDCANPYASSDIDICDLVTLEDIMEQCELGPNGALIYAADLLSENISWLFEEIEAKCLHNNPSFKLKDKFDKGKKVEEVDRTITLLFDLPGQMELYLQSDSIKSVIERLVKKFSLTTCLLELFDSSYINQVNNFVSMCLISLATGMKIQMPHISLISKIDLLKNMPAHGMLQEYFKVPSLKAMGKDLRLKSVPMLEALEELVDHTGRVSFAPCSVHMPELLHYLIFHIEKILGSLQSNMYANRQFAQAMFPFLKNYASEQMIVNLQSQLFGEEQTDWEAECQKILDSKRK